jgi:hypothetical protein
MPFFISTCRSIMWRPLLVCLVLCILLELAFAEDSLSREERGARRGNRRNKKKDRNNNNENNRKQKNRKCPTMICCILALDPSPPPLLKFEVPILVPEFQSDPRRGVRQRRPSSSVSKARFVTAGAISMKLGVSIPLGNHTFAI